MSWRSNRSIDLLLRANLAPDDEAVRAWDDWQRLKSVEDATWLELRLLAPLARRLAHLDPRSPFRPRLDGDAKSSWTTTQMIIRDSVSALAALNSAGIEFLLLKGAANYAEGMAPATRRIMGDVDVLIPLDFMSAATNALIKAGWSA